MHVDTTKKFTSLSLCSGYGGLDIGLHRAIGATRTLCYVEIESFAIYNMVKKIEEGHMPCAPIYTDLKTLNWGLFSGKVDIITGGFPCQPFSTAGAHRADSDPRHLWPHIYRGLKELGRPALVFLENVTGIIHSKLKGDEWADPAGTSVLHHVLRQLERLGYQAEAGIFSASEIGAPHQRQRVFILACRSDLSGEGREIISAKLGHTKIKGSQGKAEPQLQEQGLWGSIAGSSMLYPAGRGEQQYAWEAPRIVAHPHNSRSSRSKPQETLQAEEDRATKRVYNTKTSIKTTQLSGGTESKMGRTDNGVTCRMGDAELLTATDNRTDELRLLGNGVVPETAEKAFRVLWNRLND